MKLGALREKARSPTGSCHSVNGHYPPKPEIQTETPPLSFGPSMKTSAGRPSSNRPTQAVHFRPPCSNAISSGLAPVGQAFALNGRPHAEAGDCDQRRLSAVHVALAREQFGLRRPAGDSACAGKVFVSTPGGMSANRFHVGGVKNTIGKPIAPAQPSMTPRARPKLNAATLASVGLAPTNSQKATRA